MTTKTLEDLQKERLTKNLILFGSLGAAIGLAIGYILTTREETQHLRSGSGVGQGRAMSKQPVKPKEVLKLGMSLITVTRQISDLIKQV